MFLDVHANRIDFHRMFIVVHVIVTSVDVIAVDFLAILIACLACVCCLHGFS